MKPLLTSEEAKKRLQLVFQQSGINDEELMTYIQQLAAENDQLKRNLHKIRTSQASKSNTTSSMHSKLTDALRE